LSLADVVLDPPHFGAGSSAYDVFRLNLPLVTLPGPLCTSRYAGGCYQQMGVTDLVAKSAAECTNLAVRLGVDHDYRRYMASSIAAASGALFNDDEAVDAHQQFFAEIAAAQW
jgi:predicted O-linked N-acetylglucosamine transferase (SPINDLY family)